MMKKFGVLVVEKMTGVVEVVSTHPVLFLIGLIVGVAIIYLSTTVLLTCYYKYGRKNTLDGGDRSVMLTFDDGPDSEYTETLLDLLAVNGVHATFFLLAEKADQNPDIVDRMLAEGHQIGFHAMNHKNLWFQGPWATKRNFEEGLGLLKSHGWIPKLYRPPFGNLNPWALREMKENGLKIQLWSVMAQDWRADHSSEVILSKLRERVGNGSVICLHDSREGSAAKGQPEQTIRALESFLPQMKKRGFRFVLPGESFQKADGKTVYQNALQRKMGGAQK